MKKFNWILLLVIAIISLFNVIKPNSIRAKAESEVLVQAKSAYLIDSESGTVIFAKNENERLPIASMTKIMLLVLAFEANDNNNFSLDEQITVSKNASSMGGSQVFLEENGVYKAEDLIKSIIIASANDASVAIAERLYGSENNAVTAMNNKAKDLNLTNTLFSNCTGLMKPTQYSCAKDVAIMMRELAKHEQYFKYSTIFLDEIEHSNNRKTTLTNTNKLVKFYNGCDGGKTGFTSEAGYCLAATAKRGAMRVISVVINECDSKTRFKDVSSMFDYAFNNFTTKAVLSDKENLEIKAKISNGKQEYVQIRPKHSFYLFGAKAQKFNISVDFCPYLIKAPIRAGDEVGELIIYRDNVKIKEIKAVASCDVDKKGYLDYVKQLIVA